LRGIRYKAILTQAARSSGSRKPGGKSNLREFANRENCDPVISKLTAGAKDVALPPVREIALVGETFAYHEEL
jgi:hypothetical protein